MKKLAIQLQNKPNHLELAAKGGRSRSAKKVEASTKNVLKGVYKCKSCPLICPYKEANLYKDKEIKCTIHEDRFYAHKYGLKEIMTTKVAENKFYTIVNEVERIVQINKDYINSIRDEQGKIVPSKYMEEYIKQLSVLSKLVLDVKIHFEKPEEVGFDNKDSILTNQKAFINVVYKTITDNLDEKQAQKLIGEVHKNVREISEKEGITT